jgi:hypothetical protein
LLDTQNNQILSKSFSGARLFLIVGLTNNMDGWAWLPNLREGLVMVSAAIMGEDNSDCFAVINPPKADIMRPDL